MQQADVIEATNDSTVVVLPDAVSEQFELDEADDDDEWMERNASPSSQASSNGWKRLRSIHRAMRIIRQSVADREAQVSQYALDEVLARRQQFLENRSDSLIIHGDGVLIAFKNLSIRARSGEPILFPTSGVILPGTLTAICGASDSGTFALLNLLAGRHDADENGAVSGSMCHMTGDQYTNIDIKQVMSYVAREDVLADSSTVEEAVTLSARLRTTLTDDQRRLKIREVLRTFQLEEVSDREARALSDSQRRCLSIAIDAVREPHLFLVEEPLQRLSVVASRRIIELLRKLADCGHTVVVTARAPNAAIMDLSNDIIIMANSRVLYKGPPAHLPPYFESVGLRHASHNITAIDAVMEAIAVPESTAMRARQRRLIVRLYSTFRKRPLGKSNAKAARKIIVGQVRIRTSVLLPARADQRPPSSMLQFWLLLERFMRGHMRHHDMYSFLLLHIVVFSLLVAGVWSNSNGDAGRILHYMFFVISCAGLAIGATLPQAITDRRLFIYEIDRRMYSLAPFFTAQLLSASLPFFVFSGIIFVLTASAAGLHNLSIDALMFAWLSLSLVCVVQLAILYAVAFQSGKASTSASVLAIVLMWNVLFMGNLVTYNQLPGFLKFAFFTSHLQYSLSALDINEFGVRQADTIRQLPALFTSRWVPFAGQLAILGLIYAAALAVYRFTCIKRAFTFTDKTDNDLNDR